jgi:tRNA threonylcarbamoyladenosine biosynthesis protein TsaB
VKILALETSTEYCSVALLLGERCLTREVRAGQSHSELVLPMVDEILLESGVSLQSLDAIAFGEGPGSFTGLRIACGVAQGLAFGADLPVAGVSTLAALAAAVASPRVIACLDARMGEVYCASYRCDQADWARSGVTALCKPGEVPVPEGSGWVGCGSGFEVYGDILRARLPVDRVVPGLYPHAREIARLAESVVAAGNAIAPELAAPIYVRDKVALKTVER